MKTKILGLMAVALLAGPVLANATVITVSGTGSSDGQWNITEVFTSYSAQSTTFGALEWWNQQSLAQAFAVAYFGTSPTFANNLFFGYALSGTNVSALVVEGTSVINQTSYCNIAGGLTVATGGGRDVCYGGGSQAGERWYAFATRVVSVPEPGTLFLFGLGLAGLGLSRRRKAA